jgi:hypothetical protein
MISNEIMGKRLKIDTEMVCEEAVVRLVENEGMSGLGIYVAILLELKKRPGNSCSFGEIKRMMRGDVSEKHLCRVIYMYGLFYVEEREDGEVGILSVYLDDERKRREEKEMRRQENDDPHTGVPACTPAYTPAQAPRVVVEEKKYSFAPEEKSVTVDPDRQTPQWEEYIDRAAEDRLWLEAVAMNNRLPVLQRLPEIIALFKRHVRAQGSETTINSVQDAKRYFANYGRSGTLTYKRLMDELQAGETLRAGSMQQQDPHRYEDVDLITGERSYCGTPIPHNAPPRPDANAVWNGGNARWEL